MSKSKNILITGASGLIGARLTEMLFERGHQINHLSRSPKNGKIPTFVWDIPNNYVDTSILEKVDTIVHLAGAGVADQRWTPSRKRELLESRTKSTRLLFDVLSNTKNSVRNFISASAIGYYGFKNQDHIFTEDDNPGNDFLADVTKKWEREVDRINDLSIRVAKLRIGIVLSEKGGALKELATPVKFFAGAPLGSGKQYMSWIHIDDVCSMFVHAIENESLQGAYNAVAPTAVTNKELTKTVGRVLGKPVILPGVPSFALNLILGEMAQIVVSGSKVSSGKIERAGFQFKFRDLEGAVQNLLAPKN